MISSWLQRRIYSRSPNLVLFGIPILIVIGIVAAAAAQKADISELQTQPLDIETRPFGFERADPSRRKFGRLHWQGGLYLSAKSSVFGGYSDLVLSADGKQMLAISDAGSWLSAELVSKAGRLEGLTDTRIGPILQKGGQPLQKRYHRDAESLVLLEGNGGLEGRYFIGFEGFHRLDEYEFENGRLSGPVRRGNLPRVLKGMASNQGLEGAAIMRGGPYAGGLVLFAERKRNEQGDHTGALVKDGKAYPLYLRRTGQFDVTALDTLKDGSLLVLERSFIRKQLKLDIRLRLIPPAEIEPGATLKGETLLEVDNHYVIDNFEGMSVYENDAGEPVITLISDDNFNFFQNTLLAQFILKDD